MMVWCMVDVTGHRNQPGLWSVTYLCGDPNIDSPFDLGTFAGNMLKHEAFRWNMRSLRGIAQDEWAYKIRL